MTAIETMKMIENAMAAELPLAVSYTDCTKIDEHVRYAVCWTDRAKTIQQQKKLRQDIHDFAKKYGAVEIRDDNINTIFLAFRAGDEVNA